LPTPEDTRPAGPRRRLLPAVLGIAVSVALLWWALRGVSLADVLRHVRAAHPLPLTLAVLLGTLTFPIRWIRWKALLHDSVKPPAAGPALWHAVAVGFMANNLLPLRAGELVRSYTAARLAGIRFSTVLSSVAVERIFDGLTVVALLTVALLSSDLPRSLTIGGVSVAHVAQVGALISGAGVLLALAILAYPVSAERAVRKLFRSSSVSDRLVSLIEGVRQGLTVLRTPARLLSVLIWSLVLWLVNAVAFYVGFAAFDIPVSYIGALLLQGLLVLGIAVPSTPGFFGPFEAVIVAVLALYGVQNGLAFSYAIAYHISSFIPITVLGLWSLARVPGGLRGLQQQPL
jgi:glycosyltransferase 2 family protein